MIPIKTSEYKVTNISNNINSQIPYGVKLIGAELEWNETKGSGIKVAVLDTGRPIHSDIKVMGSVNFSDSQTGIDHQGHSTHCCGIVCANGNIKGVAPEVELYTVKVLNDNGSGHTGMLVNGIQWCIDNGIDVISMSLGSQSNDIQVHEKIKQAYDKGIIMVAAAGNDYQNNEINTIDYPARYPEVLCVSAIDRNLNHGSFSSSGVEIDVATAGVQVYSTWLNNQYAELNGTSMACPHMAGAIAILQAKAKIRYGRKLSPQEMFMLVQMYAEDIGQFGKDVQFGYGVFTFDRF